MAPAAPVSLGPTWRKRDNGEWDLPPENRTLGWQVLEWTFKYLRLPDGPDAGQSWVYTPEQMRFILHWFAVDDQGRWIYRDGMLRRVKGWGKDPVGATLCAIELVGPSRFDGWDANGMPVAVSHPASWVLTAAVSQDQTRNTMTLFPSLFSPDLIDEEKIDLGKEVIYANRGKRRLDAVTSSPRALEGPRTTFTLKNETQHWLAANDGHKMAEVINRNLVKARGGAARSLAISNAHMPGEDSDAEHDWEAWQKIEQGRSRAKGFLYDSLEAPPSIDLADEEQLRAGLRAARGDSNWLDEDRHVEEIHDTRNSPSTSRRFYLNQIVAAEDAWIEPFQYDALGPQGDETAEPLEDGDEITLGLDPSKSDDHTVLTACRISDGYTVTMRAWDPAKYGGELPRDQLDQAVETAHEKYRVVAFRSDLHPLESYVDKWAEKYSRTYVVKASPRHAVAWDMRVLKKETTIEVERLYDEIVEGAFCHDGHPMVRQHFHHARRRPDQWGVSVGKEHRESARKVDGVFSTVLARSARRAVLTKRGRRGKSKVTVHAG